MGNGRDVVLVGGPLDGMTIKHHGGFSVKVPRDVDYSKHWNPDGPYGETLYETYVLPNPDSDVLVWSGMSGGN